MAAQSKAGFVKGSVALPDKIPDYVIAELRYESQVALAPSAARFSAPPAAEDARDSLNKVLEDFDVKEVNSHFDMKKKQLEMRALAAPSAAMAAAGTPVPSEFALSGFAQIQLKNPKECDKLVKRLEKNRAVWKAYRAPRPVPAAAAPAPEGKAAGSRNFEPAQGYLHDVSNGISAMAVWNQPGGKGKNVTICDIEGAWLLDHEDLPTGIKLIGGDMINDLGAVACLQGLAKAKLGDPLPPAKVRDILMSTGTPQEADAAAPLAQRIGPLPNLAKAVATIG